MLPLLLAALVSQTPQTKVSYGPATQQYAELLSPEGPGPFPVVVMIHGGCWTAGFATLEHTRPLSEALVRAGVAVWNVEYRQVGEPGGGWPGTFEDVAAAVDALAPVAKTYRLDLTRVALAGHSAGAHLALWAAARGKLPAPWRPKRPVPLLGVVAIDGPGDLEHFIGPDEAICGAPVIRGLMGGLPAEVPARYQVGSVVHLLPLHVPQRLVTATRGIISPEQALAWAVAARTSGDEVQLVLEPRADHFSLIDPGTPSGADVVRLLVELVHGQRKTP